MPPTVAIVKCSTYSQEMVDQAISNLLKLLGGIGNYVKPENRVLLKPNLLGASHADDPTATHHTVMRSLIRQIQSVGGKPFIGDSPAFWKCNNGCKKIRTHEGRRGVGRAHHRLDRRRSSVRSGIL